MTCLITTDIIYYIKLSQSLTNPFTKLTTYYEDSDRFQFVGQAGLQANACHDHGWFPCLSGTG